MLFKEEKENLKFVAGITSANRNTTLSFCQKPGEYILIVCIDWPTDQIYSSHLSFYGSEEITW